MSADDLRIAVAAGLSIICATCTKYHQGRERGLETCTAVDGCGSPIVGDTFHEYEGPIKDFLAFCFVCGQKSDKALDVKGHRRRIGVCLKHLDFVVSMAPKGNRRLPQAPRTFVGADGRERLVDELIPEKPKNTLSTVLAEMEKGTFEPDK